MAATAAACGRALGVARSEIERKPISGLAREHILRLVLAPRTSLRLRVVPGATRSRVVGRHGDAWKVRVSAPPEGGKANDAVLSVLADVLDVSRRDLELVSGRSSRDKVVALDGMTLEAAEERLRAAAGSA